MWVHGERHEAFRRQYIETRYRLLPYIYTLAEEASRTGLPLMRPLFLEYPGFYDRSDVEFLLGRDLLVAPPEFGEMVDDYEVAFPPDEWYDFWTGLKQPKPRPPFNWDATFANAASGALDQPQPEPERIHPTLETLPVFVRAGAILPIQPVVQSTDETPRGPLELRVYPGKDCRGEIYQDDGHTFDFQKGQFLRQSFGCRRDGQTLTVSFDQRQGAYPAWWKQIEVVVYDWSGGPVSASLNGPGEKAVQVRYDSKAKALHATLPDVAGKSELVLRPSAAR